MITLTTVISTAINAAKRLVKVRYKGNDDIRDMRDAGPFGIDSNPAKGWIAVYAHTQENGKDVIVGYVNKNALAAVGETRLFSTNADGAQQTYIWLKADGTMELGGDADNAIRYTPLSNEMTSLANFINTELAKVATGLAGVGGAYTPGTCSIDISAAKIDEIKTQ